VSASGIVAIVGRGVGERKIHRAERPSTAQAGLRSEARSEEPAVPKEWRVVLCNCQCLCRASRQ